MILVLLACAAEGAPGLSEHAQSDAEIHAAQQAEIDAMKTDVAALKAKLIAAFPVEAAAAGVAPLPIIPLPHPEDDAPTPDAAAPSK
jgi:hypothetical protein